MVTLPPLILDTGEVIRAADPALRVPSPFDLRRLYQRGRTMVAAVLLRPAPDLTDARRWRGRPAAWRRVSGR